MRHFLLVVVVADVFIAFIRSLCKEGLRRLLRVVVTVLGLLQFLFDVLVLLSGLSLKADVLDSHSWLGLLLSLLWLWLWLWLRRGASILYWRLDETGHGWREWKEKSEIVASLPFLPFFLSHFSFLDYTLTITLSSLQPPTPLYPLILPPS